MLSNLLDSKFSILWLIFLTIFVLIVVSFFNSIQGWRIEKVQAEAPSAPQMPPMPASEAFEPATNFKEEEHDDLPF